MQNDVLENGNEPHGATDRYAGISGGRYTGIPPTWGSINGGIPLPPPPDSVLHCFCPVGMLPDQQPRRRATLPEERLALAVIEEVWRDLVRYEPGDGPFETAVAWVVDEHVWWPHSLPALCEVFGWDLRQVRAKLLEAGRCTKRVRAGK